MLRKIVLFLKLDNKRKLIFLEAFYFLGWARIRKAGKFSTLAFSLGEHMRVTNENVPENIDEVYELKRISEVLKVVSKYTIWQSVCFEQAVAAMKMLERRKIESTVYFGTARDEKGNFVAHAWLRSGPFIITGGEVKDQFTIVSMYAKFIK
ncbi:lasso peptide biosynthesis B2 protein [Robertmurraya beringensis]|uniref:Lasso peptide biosynthesis B2 protein n=1 Tax=Robertmurraya beringensis TaxID=641660 RepID=A0ABV6KYQ1_9BACI